MPYSIQFIAKWWDTKSQIDTSANEATQNCHVTCCRTPKSAIVKDTRKDSTRKWQNQREETTKRAITKDSPPNRRKQTGSESKLKPKCNNNYDRPWKYSILIAAIKIIGSEKCPCKYDTQTVENLIFQCRKLKNERIILKNGVFNPLTPNDHYSGRTAPLTSKRCILYIYSTNLGTEYFKHAVYSPFYSLKNTVCFIILTYLVPV